MFGFVSGRVVGVALVVLVALASLASPVEAQAVFGVSGTQAMLNSYGHTELIGQVTFTIQSGTAVSGTLELSIPVGITNWVGAPVTVAGGSISALTSPTPSAIVAAPGGISVVGTGGLGAAALNSFNAASGLVLVDVPAGGAPGDSITLAGIRISAADSQISSLTGLVSSTGNFIAAGQDTVSLVSGAGPGMLIGAGSDNSFTFTSTLLTDGMGEFVFAEGWRDAFTSAIGVLGQTVATQFTIEITGIPNNVEVTFPATVTSGTSPATITTLNGTAEVRSNQSVSSRVTYVFLDVGGSPSVFDQFAIQPGLSTTGTPGDGTAFIQVTFSPVGAAIPSMALPSTDVPRYAETLLPPLENNQPDLRTFVVPVSSGASAEQIVITNAGSGGAFLTLRALRADGMPLEAAGVTNPTTLNLQANQTSVMSLTALFGAGATTAQVASVQIQTQHESVYVSSIGTAGGGRYASRVVEAASPLYIPFDRATAVDIPVFTVQNGGTETAMFTLALRDSAGMLAGTASASLDAEATLRQGLNTLFSLDAGALPFSGYLVVEGVDIRLRAAILQDDANGSVEVPSTVPTGRSHVVIPYVVFGGGYNSRLTFVNASQFVAGRLRITAYPAGGVTPLPAFERSVAPRERVDFDLSAVYGGAATTMAYVVLEIEKTGSNPFSGPPLLTGTLNVTAPGLSAASPLLTDPATSLTFAPTAASATAYTGFAFQNNGSAAANLTLQVYSANGTSLGSATITLGAGSQIVQLLRQLVPGSLNHTDGYVSVTAGAGIRSIAYRGTIGPDELLVLQGRVR